MVFWAVTLRCPVGSCQISEGTYHLNFMDISEPLTKKTALLFKCILLLIAQLLCPLGDKIKLNVATIQQLTF